MNKKNNAKVSVIVPIYNVEEYLPKCFDSLIKQTFKDIEIWAISDGSPDNSVDIIKKYVNKDKRIKCIEKENGGYGSVLEYAIKNIKTEYFLICDPDDWLREDAIEILYNTAIKNKLDFVYGSYYFVYSNNNEEKYTKGDCYKQVYEPISNKVITKDIEKLWFMTPSPHAKLYKTNLAKNIEFPHKVSFTDWLLYSLYLPNVKRAMHLDKPLAYYLIDREGNSVTDVNPKVADFHYTVFMEITKQYLKQKNIKDYFYYRMFLQIRFINFEIAKIKNKEDYKEKRKLVYKMYKYYAKYRKIIIKYINENKYNEKKTTLLALKLLLNPIFSKLVFIYLSNKIYQEGQKNS